jgi:NADH dehydrogenase FAD-containing subunit
VLYEDMKKYVPYLRPIMAGFVTVLLINGDQREVIVNQVNQESGTGPELLITLDGDDEKEEYDDIVATLGSDHPLLLSAEEGVAHHYMGERRYEDAEDIFKSLAERCEENSETFTKLADECRTLHEQLEREFEMEIELIRTRISSQE